MSAYECADCGGKIKLNQKKCSNCGAELNRGEKKEENVFGKFIKGIIPFKEMNEQQRDSYYNRKHQSQQRRWQGCVGCMVFIILIILIIFLSSLT